MKLKVAVIGFLSLFLIALSSILITSDKAKNNSNIYTDQAALKTYEKLRGELEAVLRKGGSTEAYQYFKSQYNLAADQRIFHNLGHWLGNELYSQKGLSGISFCDETAGYGCFHGFIGAALAKSKQSFLPQLEWFCQNKTDSVRSIECVHGIGHGLLSETGYSLGNLKHSLTQCDSISKNDFLINICYSGVFMEYNLRTMLAVNESGFSVREFKALNPYDPCPNLDGNYELRCYYELPYWWLAVTNSDFSLMGNWCLAIKDSGKQESCFRGIGHVIPWAVAYGEDKAAKGCDEMPGSQYKLFCLEDAVKRLLYRNGKESLSLCNYLESSLKNRCLEDSLAFMCTNMSLCDVGQ